MRHALRLLVAISALAAAAPAFAEGATETWRLSGLKMPESVIVDEANQRLIVGNMGTFGPDGGTDGYLSIVSMDGKLVTEKWATGLIDPKGMAIVGNTLYVVDANGLNEISLADGKVTALHTLDGAAFPNDATTDGEAVYVSDLAGNAIYRFENGKAEVLLRDAALMAPNGLFFIRGILVVGSMGAGLKPDFTVDTKGGLQAFDIGTKAVNGFAGATELAMVDGVGMVNDMLVFTDNPTGTLYGYQDDKTVELAKLSPGAADLFTHGNTVYVPLTQTGELVALEVK